MLETGHLKASHTRLLIRKEPYSGKLSANQRCGHHIRAFSDLSCILPPSLLKIHKKNGILFCGGVKTLFKIQKYSGYFFMTWKTLLRPAMIFVPLALGLCFPRAAELNFLIRYLLMTMLFMVFLKLNLKDLKFRPSHWILLAVNLAVGVSAYLITRQLTCNETLAQAAFFTGITPTAAAASVVMGFLRGNVGYVITSFLVTNAGMALFMPFLLGWICGNTSFEFLGRVANTLIFLLLIPGGAAFIVRKFCPAARELPGKLATVSFGLWSLCLFIIAASAAAFFRDNPGISPWIILETALISLVICMASFGIGALLEKKRFRRESSQSLGQKNTTLTIYLALVYANPLAAMGVISYVLWHNSYNAIQLFLVESRKKKRR